MSTDGMVERGLIVTKLKTINGGRVDDQGDDANSHPRFGDESVKPYSQIIFGVPRATIGNHTLTELDKSVPKIMSFTVTAVAASRDDAGKLASKTRDLFEDWAPSATCIPIKISGGFTDAISSRGNQNRPSRYSESTTFSLIFNMGADA